MTTTGSRPLTTESDRHPSATPPGARVRTAPAAAPISGRGRVVGKRTELELLALMLGVIVLLLGLAVPADALEPGDLDTSFSHDGIVIAPDGPGGLGSEGRAVATSELVAVFGGEVEGYHRAAFGVSAAGVPSPDFDGADDPDDDGFAANRALGCPAAYSDAVATPCSGFACLPLLFAVAGSKPAFVDDVGCHGNPRFAVNIIASDGTEWGNFNQPIEGDPAEALGIARRSSDGYLIAVGVRYSAPSRVALVRLKSNLTVDTSFGGGDGVITHAIDIDEAQAHEVALQSDGKIVVVGTTHVQGSRDTTVSAFVARFTATGALDSTFGTGGVVRWNSGAIFGGTIPSGVQIASDGDIVVSGTYMYRFFHIPCVSGVPCGPSRGFVRRYTTMGTLEAGFGNGDGQVEADYGTAFEDLVIDSEDRITAVGSSGSVGVTPPSVDDFALLVRYWADGSLDSTFGGGDGHTRFAQPEASGTASLSFGLRIMSAEMSADGTEITVGGTMFSVASGDDRMFLARVVGGGPGFICGNATIDPGESCDLGDGVNGASGNCCTNECQHMAAGDECRAGAGDPNGSGFLCDPAETCSGASASCPSDVHHDSSICRAGSGDPCDLAETCPVGVGSVCGPNLVQPAGTVCRAGSGDLCDPAEACTGVAGEPCPTNAVSLGGTVCRELADLTCDIAERCTGIFGQSCPPDVGWPAATVCRVAVDVCDLTETCGGATTCPADEQKPDADTDTVCDEIDNCALIANLDQADGDSDGVGTVCDNCPDICNPDQNNADGDAGGGDVCDVCPAIDEAAEAAECATAEYNSELACCRAMSSAGISVDADGPSCGAASDVSFQTPPDPTTGTTITVEIPSGAVDGPTSISVTPMTQGGGEFILSTGVGTFVTGAIMEPAGMTFDPPLLLCMAWQDADNNGRVDNLEFVVDEANIRPTLLDETTGTETVLGPRCGLQRQCGAFGVDGLPATVPGNLDNGSLRACCSEADNAYCFEVTHFSAYAIADLSCAGEATARIIATRMNQPGGTQGLQVKGGFDLGGPIEGGLDPQARGFELVIQSTEGTPLYQVTLPAGPVSRATAEGWKSSARGGKAQWQSKTGIKGVTKVKLEWDDATGQGSFDLKGKGLSLAVAPADLPLQAEVRLDPAALAGRCGFATYTPPGGMCVFNGSGTTLLCQ